jgi:hypothetical protein
MTLSRAISFGSLARNERFDARSRQLQVRINRDRENNAGFLLPHIENAVADVLPHHAHHVGALLRRVEQ